MTLPMKKKYSHGQSLLGILIAIAIFSILAHSVFTLTSTSYSFTSFNRARITAKHLAQERLELIRNLPYSKIGTIGGIPQGAVIPQTETIILNGLKYTLKTSITYVDDPFDGTQGGTPDDALAADYKRVRVEVSWEGLASSSKNPVVLVTDIVSKGIETTTGGGTLSIFVFDANGEPVPQAELTIVATTTSPQVNISAQTASNGRYALPGADPCTACYEITVTKPGYTTARTYSTVEIANPDKPHQTVLTGQRTDVNFSIDRFSTLNIASFDDRASGFNPLANVTFRLRGTTKILGTDNLGNTVYKVDEELTTDSSGQLIISDLEWDHYVIYMQDPDPWDISGTNPLLPLDVDPNTTNNISFAVTSHTPYSLLLAMIDNLGIPIASASATAADSLGIEETVIGGTSGNPDFGQAFFANLSETTYDVTATASGFLDSTASIVVTERTQETIILNP
jgi:hypothetical protein